MSGPVALSIPEAARRMSVSRSTLYRRIWAGEIRVVKFGARTLVPMTELTRWLEAQLEGPLSA